VRVPSGYRSTIVAAHASQSTVSFRGVLIASGSIREEK
jgi:hypothetical protein